MPTYRYFTRFLAEFRSLPADRRILFMAAVKELVSDLGSGAQPRPSLRVKRVTSHPGVWELSWAADGRATFEYGSEIVSGHPHVVWRRIGGQEIFRQP